jgi:type IV secretory pathway TrbF-like protein
MSNTAEAYEMANELSELEEHRSLTTIAFQRKVIGALTVALLIVLIAFARSATRRTPVYVVGIRPDETIVPAHEASGDMSFTEDQFIRQELRNFVRNFRTVSPDLVDMRARNHQAYQFVARMSQAKTVLDTWGQTQQPDKAAIAGKAVEVDVQSVRGTSGAGAHTYVVDWTETPYDEKGHASSPVHWRGSFNVVSGERSAENPTGEYVKEIDWGQVQ